MITQRLDTVTILASHPWVAAQRRSSGSNVARSVGIPEFHTGTHSWNAEGVPLRSPGSPRSGAPWGHVAHSWNSEGVPLDARCRLERLRDQFQAYRSSSKDDVHVYLCERLGHGLLWSWSGTPSEFQTYLSRSQDAPLRGDPGLWSETPSEFQEYRPTLVFCFCVRRGPDLWSATPSEDHQISPWWPR